MNCLLKIFFQKIIIPQSRINTFTPNNPDVREKYNNDEFILLRIFFRKTCIVEKNFRHL